MRTNRATRRTIGRLLAGEVAALVALAVAVLAACAQEAEDAGRAEERPLAAVDGAAEGSASAPACSGFEHVADFSVALRETSGLARSAHSPSVLWTHNDSGGEPSLAAIDLQGRTLGVVRVRGARNRDWEALSAGPCPEGDCLWVGDIGDNLNERESVTVYRVPEPAVDAGASAPARAWSVRYPGGARDAEALAVHPATGELWIVAKGRAHPVQVFRVPLSEDADTAVAEPVVWLTRGPVPFRRMVTGATFTPDGRWLLVRSYTELFFLPVDEAGVPGPPASRPADLTPLGERQGEAVEAFSGGVVYFTSESESAGGAPELSRARCDLR